MKYFIRALGWILKVLALLVVISLPFCPIFDWLNPWPPAVKTLAEFSGQKHFCVGYGAQSEVKVFNGTRIEKTQTQRAFILIPSVFLSPKVIFISEDPDGKISKDESRFAFWFLVITYLACLWSTWRFWIRPFIKRHR